VLVSAGDAEVTERSPARKLGHLEDVQLGAGEAPLLIVRGESPDKQYLIPFAEPYLKTVDTASRRIVLVLPEGMLELDAPLNREEKERQHHREE
jgi:ribosomal 30S subunit maturation factor RimM